MEEFTHLGQCLDPRAFNGLRKNLSLGTYPDTGLALALKKADDARKLVAEGVDPSEVRKDSWWVSMIESVAAAFRDTCTQVCWIRRNGLRLRCSFAIVVGIIPTGFFNAQHRRENQHRPPT